MPTQWVLRLMGVMVDMANVKPGGASRDTTYSTTLNGGKYHLTQLHMLITPPLDLMQWPEGTLCSAICTCKSWISVPSSLSSHTYKTAGRKRKSQLSTTATSCSPWTVTCVPADIIVIILHHLMSTLSYCMVGASISHQMIQEVRSIGVGRKTVVCVGVGQVTHRRIHTPLYSISI